MIVEYVIIQGNDAENITQGYHTGKSYKKVGVQEKSYRVSQNLVSLFVLIAKSDLRFSWD